MSTKYMLLYFFPILNHFGTFFPPDAFTLGGTTGPDVGAVGSGVEPGGATACSNNWGNMGGGRFGSGAEIWISSPKDN
jgi:hypothetical protein